MAARQGPRVGPAEDFPGWCHRRGRAFGVELDAEFAIDGLGSSTRNGPATVLRRVSVAALEARWPARDAVRIVERRGGDGRLALTIDHHVGAGFRLWHPGAGRYVVSADGVEVECALPAVGVGRWQRYLAAQVLPLVAALRGRAVIHASAVTVGERALAFVAASGAGKTSLAVRLTLGGAAFLTDDALALDPENGRVVAHPGLAFATMAPADREVLSVVGRGSVGAVVRRSDKIHVSMPSRSEAAAPLAAVYFLERIGEGREVRVEALTPPDPRLLLASAFLPHLAARARLSAQLRAAAEMARSVATFRVRVPSAAGAAAVAESIAAHAAPFGASA